MKNIAIIPAKSGYEGLRDKNILPFCGRPLMAHTIEAAVRSRMFDEIAVSTDSEKYADIARQYGASVPFLCAAQDPTGTASAWDTVREILSCYDRQGQTFDSFCLLQPTSPLRTGEDICAAYRLFEKASVAVISVCEADHSPLRYGRLGEDGSLNGFAGEDPLQCRDTGKYYRMNGAICIANIKAFLEDENLYRAGSYAYIMDKRLSVDIDDEFDLEIAAYIREHFLDTETDIAPQA